LTNRSGSPRHIAGIDLATRGDVMRYALLLVLLGPLAAFLYVRHELTSGAPRIALRQALPLVSEPVDWSKFSVGPGIDKREIQRLNDENLSRQVQESSRRMQDVSAYMRNPAGWRGLPPR
jgi:hypothetical protein